MFHDYIEDTIFVSISGGHISIVTVAKLVKYKLTMGSVELINQ